MKKVAVCISGQMRSFEHCVESLMKNVIQPLNADIFFHVWSDAGCSHKENVEVADSKITEEKLRELYSPIVECVIEDFLPEYCDKFKGIVVPGLLKKREPLHYKNNIPMFYKLYECNELKKKEEACSGKKYDIVIRIRPDMFVGSSIPLHCLKSSNILWFSDYHLNINTQVSDKFVLSNSYIMDYYCSVWKFLSEYWNVSFDPHKKTNRVGERLMFYHMSKSTFLFQSFHIACHILRMDGSKV